MLKPVSAPASPLPDHLEMIEGQVSGLQRTVDVGGGGGQFENDSIHVCAFEIDGRRVQFADETPPPIAEGDRLRLIGAVTNGIFEAHLCRNITTGWVTPEARSKPLIPAMVTALFLSLPIGILAFAFNPLLGLFAAVAVFLAVHSTLAHKSGRTLARRRLLS